jgi:hypothetical protein
MGVDGRARTDSPVKTRIAGRIWCRASSISGPKQPAGSGVMLPQVVPAVRVYRSGYGRIAFHRPSVRKRRVLGADDAGRSVARMREETGSRSDDGGGLAFPPAGEGWGGSASAKRAHDS